MTSRAVLVLGMHRSGTSAVTGVLSLLGAGLGRELVPASPFNEAGHFENAEVVRLHERVLAELGHTWDSVMPLPAGWVERPAIRALASELRAILERELLPSPIWAVKDPRLCRLLPLWRPILAELGVRPRFVIMVRDPYEVAESLAERDGLPAWRSSLLYLDHMIVSELDTRHDTRVFVSYHALLDDPVAAVDRMLRRLDLTDLSPDRDTQERIRAFLSPSLEHARHAHPTSARHSWLAACHAAIDAAASDRPVDAPGGLAGVLDGLAPAVAEACTMVGATPSSVFGESTVNEGVADAGAERGESADSSSTRGRWAVRVLRETLDAREAELGRARSVIDELGRQIEAAREAQQAHAEELAELRRDLSAAQERSGILEDTVKDRDRECAGLAGALGAHDPPRPDSPVLVETTDLLFAVSLPRWSAGESTTHRLSGWISSSGGTPIERLRVWAGAQVFEAVLGLDRGELGTPHPEVASAASSGFEVEVTPPAHAQRLVFEVDRGRGRWERVAAVPIDHAGPTLLASIDVPRRLRIAGPRQRVAGWCFSPGDRVVRLELRSGAIHANARYGFERPDVVRAFPDLEPDPRCGFDGIIRMPPGVHAVALIAELESGAVVTHAIPRPFLVIPLWAGNLVEWLARCARWLARQRELVRFLIHRALDYRRRTGRIPPLRRIPTLVGHAVRAYRDRHRVSGAGCLPPGMTPPRGEDAYALWQRVNTWHSGAAEDLAGRLARAPRALPRISVILPVYDPPLAFLERAIQTVVDQVYPNWELCIADDASTNPAVRPALERWMASDPRIRVVFRTENGHISRATNSAAALATGELLAFLDQDDELSPDALAEVALHVAEQPETDLLYSDDDKIDVEGMRYAPQFKPGWSPELLLSYMYCTHLLVVRRSLFDEVGGCRTGFEGSQDHDLALRVSERARRVGHLPSILYHWRAAPGSTATRGSAKPESFEAGRRAVEDAIARRGARATVSRPSWAVNGDLGIFAPAFPDDGPSVAILIPTKDQLAALRACIRSLEKTRYRNHRVVVIDNESGEADTQRFLAGGGFEVIRIASPEGSFNFSALVNAAARAVEADHLLFLNNDTEVCSPDWLSTMMGYARLPGVGAVGAHLIYPDGRTQHAGIVLGLHHGLAGHAFKLTRADEPGYLSYKAVARNYSAVTGACLLTPRRLFLELGGFDEERFGVAYNDVDYGIRLRERGLRSVYVPTQLVHHEGLSRGFSDDPREVGAFRRIHGGRPDPYFSPHLSLSNERFEIQPRRLARDRSKRVRALFVSHNLNHEGAPQHQYDLAVALARDHGLEPTVISPVDGPLRALYHRAGVEVRVEPHPLEAAADGAAHARAIERFGERLRREAIDVVHANTLHAFHAVAAAHRAGLPSVWNIHESEGCLTIFGHHPRHVLDEVIRSFALPYRVIFTADAACEVYRCLNSHHNFTVIHDALDPGRLATQALRWPREEARRSLEIEGEALVVLVLGTVCERKGQLDLPLALRHVPEAWWPRVRWLIVGDRGLPYSRDVAGAIAALPERLRVHVQLLPETPDPIRFFQAADLFVCTSRVESFPHVLLEAMSFGLPIVTTPVFGVREQVRENVNALFYEPGDPAALAQALVRLLADEPLRQQLASNSRPVLAGLTSFPEMVAAYAEILREAAATAWR